MKTINELQKKFDETNDFETQIELAGMIHALKMRENGVEPNDSCGMDEDCLSCGA